MSEISRFQQVFQNRYFKDSNDKCTGFHGSCGPFAPAIHANIPIITVGIKTRWRIIM